ncbi:endoglucanase A-like [Schistocerca americana]|uniref:endoglucanase A-like n=1 Tax=Schistocerca americana TaxID=7009 RepID=UPI001F4FBC46|nr:endoglucanase A-like [Schistocerca americana]
MYRFTALSLLTLVGVAYGATYNYTEVIYKSLLFYQAQRSGKLTGMDPLVSWRKDSCLDDKGIFGEDLTQGYFDAGDFVKFTFPATSAFTVLSWGAIEFQAGYQQAGLLDGVRDAIKWGTDWLLKAHPQPNQLYLQVGDGTADHNYWGRPEDINFPRPAYLLNESFPGTDAAGEAAAALASASIVFQSVDAEYSATLLNAAIELLNFADTYRALCTDSIPEMAQFYTTSGYTDELVWGYVWVYKATEDNTYLQRALELFEEFQLQYISSYFSYDQKTMGIVALLAEITGDEQFSTQLSDHCTYMVNQQQRTPLKLLYISDWGNLRLAANVALTCLKAAALGINTEVNQALAKEQIGYILGDTGRSYVVGFGENPPVRPHHRSASCPDAPATCDWTQYSTTDPNPHVLYGALVGGPDANDAYYDDRTDYQHNEVALDFNAGFQGVVAALVQLGL